MLVILPLCAASEWYETTHKGPSYDKRKVEATPEDAREFLTEMGKVSLLFLFWPLSIVGSILWFILGRPIKGLVGIIKLARS